MKLKSILHKLKWNLNELPKNSTITFLNPYSYLLVRNLNRIDNIDFIGIDGGLLKSGLNIFFKTNIKRISFDNTSLAPKVYKHCIEKNKTIYFIGTTDSNIKQFIKILKTNYAKLKIKGYRNGYFKNIAEREDALATIVKINPDYVVAGMGTPYQENFILDLKEKGFTGISFTCGGYFHQTIKGMDYYPKFYDRFNLRWLYRIIDEPKLFSRYFFKYPQAMFYFFLDMTMHKIKK
jgi:N-acetylglucosaminyldiphosphoundecaprenol N-acetyl-beta-D-mannosaminyltransferase